MKQTPDDELARRYREVSERLDEAPSAQTRAAILAAAARQVQARPGDASKPVQRPTRSFARWPLGAAAAVMLSTLAVLLADRTEREINPELASTQAQPARVDAGPSARPELTKPAPPASVADSAKVTTEQTQSAQIKRSEVRIEEREVPVKESRARRADAPSATAASGSSDLRQVPATPAPPRIEVPVPSAESSTSQPAASAPQSAVDATPADNAAMGQLRKQERDQLKPLESRSNAAPAAAPSTGASGRAAAKAEGSTAVWLERIIELRRLGHDAEADSELKTFRERYPEVVIPPQALRPLGTR